MSVQYTRRPELAHGGLSQLFRNGANAVVVREDPRFRQLWSRVVEGQVLGEDRFWEQGLVPLARNHLRGNLTVGDFLRFVPNGISHQARKLLFAPIGDEMRYFPTDWADPDHNGVGENCDVLWTAWDVATELLESLLPGQFKPGEYAVSLESLKYPDSVQDLDAVLALLSDAGGGWARFGHRLDAEKNLVSDAFDYWALRNAFALGSLVPGLRSLLRTVNKWGDQLGGYVPPPRHRVVGATHVDGGKVLTTLIGDRAILRTEIRHGRQWSPVPVTTDSIVVIPSGDITKYSSLQPTRHRVLMETEQTSKGDALNATLVMAVIDINRLPKGLFDTATPTVNQQRPAELVKVEL